MVVCALLLAGVVSFVLTGLLRRYALSKSLLDVPNSRSSHTVPTPRSGGLAFVIAISLSATLFGLYYGIENQTLEIYNVVIIGGIIIAAIGLVDDFRHVPAIWRLLVHTIVASYAVIALGIPGIVINGLTFDPNIFLEIMFVIGVIWLINLFNFMDGIDGLAGAETVCVTGGAALILLLGAGYASFITQPEASYNFTLVFLLLILMISVFGFLIWNWPPAKIFMGDVGSSYLGFVFGVLVISTPVTSILTLWTWLILLGVFFVDATTTLISRMVNGERWYTAHRTHAYQHAAQKFGSHRVVTVSVILINILWLFPLAWLATMKPGWGALLTIIAYMPLIILAIKLSAGKL
jgi:Fuc2NAc and GlcNAc transferase